MTAGTRSTAWAAKRRRLEEIFDRAGSMAVAFSGGVDSSLVLAVAHARLGERALAVTGVSPSLAGHQLERARAFASRLGVRHLLLETEEIDDDRYAANGTDRCRWCKNELYGRMRVALGAAWPHVADGNNVDDLGDHRPGMQAARTHGVISPLIDAGFTKDDVRALARELGLETAELPAAPCLSSRIPYGDRVTPERLSAVERGEDAARALGVLDFRLRHLGEVGRLELSAPDLARVTAADAGERLCREVAAAAGLIGVRLDPRPLRSGRLNEEAGIGEGPAHPRS